MISSTSAPNPSQSAQEGASSWHAAHHCGPPTSTQASRPARMNILLLRRTGPSVGACHSRWLSQQMASASATAAAPLQRQQRQQSQQPQAHPQPQQHFPSAFLQAALNGTGSGSNGSSGPKIGAATATATAAASTVSASAAAAGTPRTDTATATATAAPLPQRPYPAHVVDGREEEMVERWCQKTPQPVSLRTLVQVGLGRRPFLSSLRDACSLRDALNSLNTRLQINANTTSAEEVREVETLEAVLGLCRSIQGFPKSQISPRVVARNKKYNNRAEGRPAHGHLPAPRAADPLGARRPVHRPPVSLN